MHSPAWDRAQLRRALRQLLKETGLSPQDIAEMAGVSRPQVSRWMSGENRPGFDAALRLARALQRDYPGQQDLVTDFVVAAGYPSAPIAAPGTAPVQPGTAPRGPSAPGGEPPLRYDDARVQYVADTPGLSYDLRRALAEMTRVIIERDEELKRRPA